ncbi:hypothetical protein [Actinoallomurus iriomotensis]|uniref:Uncharacterized protein n=1 Tax=Actinoallomurus iriomotensis TaxID=478107 RepID=A0A9W6RLK0_9ACTN|nr:hypothetical protein Airi01_043420 [Actinoallomurus iriomotensis]
MLDIPGALKAGVGRDRVQITTGDEAAIAALRERFGVEAGVHDGAVTFAVPSGEAFVPRLIAESSSCTASCCGSATTAAA